MAKGYDVKCLDLARVFLSDEPPSINTEENAVLLAQEIQTTIEEFLYIERKGGGA
jgi:hypothetical protein